MDPATNKHYKTRSALKAGITRRKNAKKKAEEANQPKFPTVTDPDNHDPDFQIHDSFDDAVLNLNSPSVDDVSNLSVVSPGQQRNNAFGNMHTVEIMQECVPFIPGTDKLKILEDWCAEHCKSGWKVFGSSGMNWLFETSADAKAFILAWNTRTAKRLNLKKGK